MGFGPAIIQRPNLENRHIRTAFISSIIFGLLTGFIIFITAPLIASFFQMAEITPILRAVAFLFPIRGCGAVAESLATRAMRFRNLAMIEVTSYLVGFGLTGIILALTGFGVWALVAAHLMSSITSTLILLKIQPHSKRPKFERVAFQELLYFGGGITLSGLLTYVAMKGDNIVIGRWLGAEALGFYGRAYQLVIAPINLFGSVLDRVMFPSMAKIQDNPKRLVVAYRRGISLIGLLCVPTSVLGIVLAPELVLVLLGPAWTGIVLPLQILVVGMYFRASPKISHALARATGAVYNRAWRQGVYAFVVLVGTWLGQHWGIAGVAMAILITFIINYFLMAHLSLSLISLTWTDFFAAHIPAFILALFTLGEVWTIATWLREQAWDPIVILFTTAIAAGVTQLVLLFIAPHLFLGQDGKWMVKMLSEIIAEKVGHRSWVRQLMKRYANS